MDPQRRKKGAQPRREYNLQESLAPTLPLAPSVDITSRLPVGYILAALWVVAAVAAGIGIGLLVARGDRAQLASAPYPVATVSLKVMPASAGPAITIASPAVQANLTVNPASSVNQAQAGTP